MVKRYRAECDGSTEPPWGITIECGVRQQTRCERKEVDAEAQ